jgi:predicted nucleic acid binding AN1-type Zn finger protein
MTDKIIQEEQDIQKHSKNSLTAKSGFKAEDIFRTDELIKCKLEEYFGKKISSLDKIHGKKYDTKINFEDGSSVNIQNKKIENLGGRGDSFDRRHIKNTFNTSVIRKYLTLLTLIRKSKNETLMSEEQKIDFIKLCNNNLDDILQYIKKTLIGEDAEMNDYWCIMKTNKTFTNTELYIISSKKMFEFIEQTIKIDIKLKKNGTCLHLSPYIVLQRKGGGNTDHSPNHIQAKLKFTQEILNLCDKLT